MRYDFPAGNDQHKEKTKWSSKSLQSTAISLTCILNTSLVHREIPFSFYLFPSPIERIQIE